VLFANFAESVAEGRGKAAADSLRATRVTTKAKLIVDPTTGTWIADPGAQARRRRDHPGRGRRCHPDRRRDHRGHRQRQRGGHHRRERAGDPRERRRPLGRHRRHAVVSDWIKVRVTAEAGNTFLDRMIAMVEGASAARRPTRSPWPCCWPA
jgi:K+-transporting ATPase ATPase B chain